MKTDRLEVATEGSRELDRFIYWLLDLPRIGDMKTTVPAYSTSIDAALSLIPEGRLWSIGSIVNGSGFVAVLDNSGKSYRGASPALALCIAAMRASPVPIIPSCLRRAAASLNDS